MLWVLSRITSVRLFSHNIGFYEELTKIIFQFSSNISSSETLTWAFAQTYQVSMKKHWVNTVKFLNFRTPENFAVIQTKSQNLLIFGLKMQME